MSVVALASDPFKKPVLNLLIREGKIDKEVIQYCQWEQLSERYGWLPSEIKKQDSYDLNFYQAIINAKEALSDIRTPEPPKSGAVKRRLK